MLHKCEFLFGRRALLMGLFAVCAATTISAQNQMQWTTVMYRKSEPGKAADHRKFIETTWTRLAQAMIDEGTTSGAVAMRLTTPYVANADYDYVTVSFAAKRPSVAPVPAATLDARARKAGFENWQKFLEAANAVSRTARLEWLTTNLRLGGAQPGNYMRLMRYKVEREHLQAVDQFLNDYSVPLQKARMKEGSIQGYSIHRPAMVTADEAGFSQSISWILKDADAVMSGPAQMSEEWFKRALPGKSYAEYIRQLAVINTLRRPVATRIYEVVAVAGAMPQAAPAPSGQ